MAHLICPLSSQCSLILSGNSTLIAETPKFSRRLTDLLADVVPNGFGGDQLAGTILTRRAKNSFVLLLNTPITEADKIGIELQEPDALITWTIKRVNDYMILIDFKPASREVKTFRLQLPTNSG